MSSLLGSLSAPALLAHLVVPRRLRRFRLVFRRHLWPVDAQRDLVDLSGDGEWRLAHGTAKINEMIFDRGMRLLSDFGPTRMDFGPTLTSLGVAPRT